MPFFEESFLFSASEADLYRRMKLSAVLRHMQDAAGRHLAGGEDTAGSRGTDIYHSIVGRLHP